MKIAIVSGGFDGIIAQRKRWELEEAVQAAAQAIVHHEALLAKARCKHAELVKQLSETPTQEIAG